MDFDKLRESERQKIRCAEKHSSLDVFDGIRYRVVEKLSELENG